MFFIYERVIYQPGHTSYNYRLTLGLNNVRNRILKWGYPVKNSHE